MLSNARAAKKKIPHSVSSVTTFKHLITFMNKTRGMKPYESLYFARKSLNNYEHGNEKKNDRKELEKKESIVF